MTDRGAVLIVDPAAVPAPVLAVCRRLRDVGRAAYVVGGAVRDLCSGRAPHDWDVATDARPDEVAGLFPHTVLTGARHGTVTVVDDAGGMLVEVTTFRADGDYGDGRRPDAVEFINFVTPDLARRDFTVNAMAWDPLSDELIDPHGGRADLDARVLRCVGDPAARFAEDGLRCLRAVRFAATLELSVAPATFAAISSARPTFRKVAAERVRDELVKLMAAPRPSVGLRLLLQTSLLDDVLPELLPQVGMAQNRWHAHDVWHHTLAVVDAAPPRIRIAALLHDAGKPATRAPHPQWPGEFSFHGHDAAGDRIAGEVMARLRFPREAIDRACALVRHHMLFVRSRAWNAIGIRRFVAKVGADLLDDLFALRRADVAGSGRADLEELAGVDALRRYVDAELARRPPFSRKDLAVDGADVMAALGWRPSPAVGLVLARLVRRVIDDPDLNVRERLLALAPAAAAALDAPDDEEEV